MSTNSTTVGLPPLSDGHLSGVSRAGIDGMPIEAAILDNAGDIVLVNCAWREFADDNHGTNRSYWVGENYFDACNQGLGDADTDTIIKGLRGLLTGDRNRFTAEYPCHSPDEERWFRMDASGFTYEGECYAFLTHLNITERKIAEQQAQGRLSQLETLVGVLSHDLRNPLNMIQGYTEMLANDLGDDERIDRIAQAAARISEITEATLTFTKAGSLTDTEPVDLEDIVEAAWRNVDTKEATLVIDETYQFHGDRSLLLQLFENAFRNAIEHVGRDCRVRVGALDRGFYIEDDGEGMTEELVEKALDADFSTQGTGGLGISIIQAVAQAHGGTLRITSSDEGGARFEIAGLDPRPE